MAVARPISPIPRLSSARARRSAAAAAALPAALASSLRPPCAARRADLLGPTTPSMSPPRPPVLCKRTPAWPLPLLSAGALGRTASAAPTDDAEAPAATSVAAAFVANSTSVGPPAATNRGTSTTRLAFKEGSQVLGAEPCGDTTTAVSRFRLRDTLSSNSDSSTKDDCLVSRRGVDGRAAAPNNGVVRTIGGGRPASAASASDQPISRVRSKISFLVFGMPFVLSLRRLQVP